MTTLDIFSKSDDIRTYQAGDVIFREGDAGHEMLVIKTGEVDVVIGGTTLYTEGSGGVIGEMALIDGSPRSASAVARTECSLVAVPEKRFLLMIQQTPFFALQVMRILTERLRRRTPRG
jgi:CRP-like cAMP-binding protein